MRDGITLSRAGHPVVVFVYNTFERAARAQAQGLGVPDLRFYVYPQFTPGQFSPAVEEEKAEIAAKAFSKLLVGG